MSLRLSIDRNCLERLLGGNTEIEIELRQQVVNEFAKRYLEPIADSETTRAVVKALQECIQEEIRNTIGMKVGLTWHTVTKLKEEIQSLIQTQVEKIVEDTIRKILQGHIDTQAARWTQFVETMIQKRLEVVTDKIVQEEIKRRLQVAATLK